MCHAAGQVKVKAAELVTGPLQVRGKSTPMLRPSSPCKRPPWGRQDAPHQTHGCLYGLLEEVLVDLDDVDGALDLDTDAVADHQAGETGAVDEDDTGGD